MNDIPWYDLVLTHGKKAFIALAILIIGLTVAKILRSRMHDYLKTHTSEPTAMLFLVNAVYGVLLTIIAIIILAELGVPTASLLTILGASSIAIGLALKGSLSNIANGILLIFLKPFKRGDFIEVGGITGTVDQINLFTTRITSANNELIYVPNAKVMSDKIKNITGVDKRRIDLSIGIGYEADIKKAKQIINRLLNTDKRILEQPSPAVIVKELGDSAVMLGIRPWVRTKDYGGVLYELTEAIKLKFDEEKISIPYPQMDIHLDRQGNNE